VGRDVTRRDPFGRFVGRSPLYLVERVPLLNESGFDVAKTKALDKHGEDVSDSSGRWRVDGLGTESVQRGTQLLAGSPVGPGKDVQVKADLTPYALVGEVEDSVEGDVVAVERPGKKVFDSDCLTLSEPPQLGYRARAALAQVEGGKAPRRIESPTIKTRALPTERIVERAKMPPAFAGEWCKWRGGYAADVDGHPTTPSHPRL